MSRSRRRWLVVAEPPLPAAFDGLPVVTADAYLEGAPDPPPAGRPAKRAPGSPPAADEVRSIVLDEGVDVVNLCRSWEYLSKGYYVSLVAEARRQRALPSLAALETIADPFTYLRGLQEEGIKTVGFRRVGSRGRPVPRVLVLDAPAEPGGVAGAGTGVARVAELTGEGADGEQRARFAPRERTTRDVRVLLGRATDPAFARLGRAVFRRYSFPALEIRLYGGEDGWKVGQVFPLPLQRLSAEETEVLARELAGRAWRRGLVSAEPEAPARPMRLACLFDPSDPLAPSDEATLDRLDRAAARRGLLFERIGPRDLDRLAEHDGLFIRTVTAIDHYSFTFARTAASLGMPVIDDPASILKCSNKIFLWELFRKHDLPAPPTAVVSKKSLERDAAALGFPLVLKIPDGTFSQAVERVDDVQALSAVAGEMFRRSPLLIAQRYMPTAYDWRVGVLGGEVLWTARYHMVQGHWQIARRAKSGRTRYGKVEAVPVAEAPPEVVRLALEATALVGDGLYGVDLKEGPEGPLLIEINDNPNLETGFEDAADRDRPYEAILDWFLARLRESVHREGER